MLTANLPLLSQNHRTKLVNTEYSTSYAAGENSNQLNSNHTLRGTKLLSAMCLVAINILLRW